MFKRNKVQGKHAAHAVKKNDDVREAAESYSTEDSATSEDDFADIPAFSGAVTSVAPSIDIPPIEPHAMRGIDLPEIGPDAATEGETVRMDPVSSQGGNAGATQVGPDEFMFGSPVWNPVEPEKERKPVDKKKLAIVAGVVAGVILLVYVIGAIVFAGRFYPNTVIGGADVSMKSVSDAASEIDSLASDYTVDVEGQGLDFQVSSDEMGIEIDGDEVARSAHAKVPSWGWPVYVFKSNDLTDCLAAQYNEGGLKEIVDAKVEEWNKNASDPVNATISYNSEAKSFEVASESVGEKLDAEAVLEVVDTAVLEMEPKAQITEDQLLQPTVLKDDERLKKAVEDANGYIGADIQLKMDGYDAGTIDGSQVSEWVTLDGDLNVTFDEEAMDEWLTDLGNSLDTVGSERTYTRPDGKKVTVEGGTYGWEVDSEALAGTVRDAIVNGTQGEVEVPVIASGVYYNAENGIDWADYIDVDLSEQHARYITEGGEVKWESDVVTGTPDGTHDTPTGVWTLFSMESPATLKGDIQVATGQPEYETQVQYWMPFTYSGCGFHDATWQPAFGGSLYEQGYGSHGCVNLPYDAAASLFDIATVGLPVSVHW